MKKTIKAWSLVKNKRFCLYVQRRLPVICDDKTAANHMAIMLATTKEPVKVVRVTVTVETDD